MNQSIIYTERMNKLKLYGIQLETANDQARVTVQIESEALREPELWFSVEEQYREYLAPEQYDSFLVGLLYPAMKHGEDIHIEGKISKKLLKNVNTYVIPLIQSYSPDTKRITVTADELTTENFRGNGIGTGFSGGIDSFHTVYRQYEMEEDPDYKVNSFLFLNVGAHGYDGNEDTDTKFRNRYDYLKQFPNEVGLEFIAVDSNLPLFLKWGFQKVHSIVGAAGVLFLQKNYKRYLYASTGMRYGEAIQHAPSYKDMDIGAYSDPILLPLLSTESTELVSDGLSYDRVEKTIDILNYEPVFRYLNVCVRGDDTHENCSVCPKCCRTLMTLNSLDKLDEVDGLFDVAKYKEQAEYYYMCRQVHEQDIDPFAKSNVELAEQNDVPLPSRTKAAAVLKYYGSRNWLGSHLSAKTRRKIKNVIRK